MKIKQTFYTLLLLFFLILPFFVFAASPLGRMKAVGEKAGFDVHNTDDTTFSSIIGTVISVFLSLLGIIFVILIIYAGYNWMTAHGNDDKVLKAQKTMTRAVIGLVITLSAYAIWLFIQTKLL